MSYTLEQMPEGYQLQMYDDCGVPNRQPHIVRAPDTTTHAYAPEAVQGGAADTLKARTVVTNPKQVDAVYEGLKPDAGYALAVTYASEPFNKRVQSLWAGEIQLHGPRPLPTGKAERLLFRVPRETITDGRLALHFKLEGPVNVVVSAIELWAPLPAPKVLYLANMNGLASDIEGKVLNLAYDGVADAEVELRAGGKSLATAKSAPDGGFTFARDLFEKLHGSVEVVARRDGAEARHTFAVDDLYFEPVRYRPMPEGDRVALDGPWRINVKPGPDARSGALDGWAECHVPGQWRQQGFDVPLDQHVAMAREFEIPKSWEGKRIFLRLDAIHAGTRYWLNGHELGYSENLFTPVEWELTQFAKPGQTNRLDLDMVVDTVSEKLSYSCGYAFHNLGGIDRSVRLYALPAANIRSLKIDAGLDERNEDGQLRIDAPIDNPNSEDGLRLAVELRDQHDTKIEMIEREDGVRTIKNPEKWNAEKPYLYKLKLELKQRDKVLERIERQIGFRKIEIRDAQLYINGQRVKLAGACHHELDPLTGRADTARHAEEDVALMKGANLNHIRTSHYPPTQELLDAADRIGMYVEVEAPFCWVPPSEDMAPLKQVLTPTSAMIDYCHSHPSVIMWSLANESSFNRFFEVSNKLVKELDPTRPTTFNNPDPKRICDIANVHYPPMPYDEQLKDDPRPLYLGEYFFPVCHEQTDVTIDPGLRELWGHGHADPDSDWGKYCAASFDARYTHPGVPPGAWTHIYNSNRIIGASIWAAIDEPYYLPDGQKVGYAWHHGFWGLIDTWRRPKPEWYLARNIFSPVWFPKREIELKPGQMEICIPVQNRFSFVNLKHLQFVFVHGEGLALFPQVDVPPGQTGELRRNTLWGNPEVKPGDQICLRVNWVYQKKERQIAEAWITLGKKPRSPLPQPEKGAPAHQEDSNVVLIKGDGFGLLLDKKAGDFRADDPRHTAAVIGFPRVHVTRFDFGDLANEPPYAVLPDPATRVVDNVEANEQPEGLALVVHEHYGECAGQVTWLIDKKGVGKVSYDYVYTGGKLNAREIGVRFVLKPTYDELKWRRWSEWGDFPKDAICRAAGTAKAHRDPALGTARENEKPNWPWALDETELGTNDFRSIKFNVYNASLNAPDGSGLAVYANADKHVRACLDPKGVLLHVLTDCRLGPVVINNGDHIKGEFSTEIK